MVRDIVKDTFILSRISVLANKDDLSIAQDLIDTLEAHKESCAGMAANMIGFHKRIIAFQDEGKIIVMLNPEIIKKSQIYSARRMSIFIWSKRNKTISKYQSSLFRYADEDKNKNI